MYENMELKFENSENVVFVSVKPLLIEIAKLNYCM